VVETRRARLVVEITQVLRELVDQRRIDLAIARSAGRILGQTATNVVVQVHWRISAGGL
jgi:hypothetical protein